MLASSYQFNYQRSLVAQMRELLPKLFRHDELLPAGIITILTHSSYHVAMRQKLAPSTYNSSKLVVLLLLHIKHNQNI